MTDKDLVKELRKMAFIMNRMGDFRKESILNQAGKRLDQLTSVRKLTPSELNKIQGLPNENERG